MIWILEDDDQTTKILARALSSYEPLLYSTLSTFEEAWDKSECKPLLVIADLNLPDGNFQSFLAKHYLSQEHSTRFILISATDDIDIMRRCFSLGATDYLVKPLSMAQIQLKVERCLEPLSQILILEPKNLKALGPLGEVKLTSKQFQIAAFFLEMFPEKVHKEELQKAIWKETRVNEKNIQVHISLLRARLRECGVDILFDKDAYVLSVNDKDQGNPRNMRIVPRPAGLPPPA